MGETGSLDDQVATARALHRQGRLAEAERVYRAVLAARPDHAEALFLTGVLALQRGDAAAAEETLARAVALDPAPADPWYNLALARIARGKPAEAKAALEAALARAPDHADAAYYLGWLAHGRGEIAAAAAAYERALAADPDHVDALNNLGLVRLDQGRLEEALALLERAAAKAPQDARTRNNLGTALTAAKRFAEAAAAFQAALEARPDYAEAAFNLGNAEAAAGRVEAAVAAYGRAVALKPDYAGAHLNLGNALRRLGRDPEAIAAYRAALALAPDNALALNNLGGMCLQEKRAEEALALLARAVERAPAMVEARANYADALRDVGREEEAIAEYRAAFRLDPGYWRARWSELLLLPTIYSDEAEIARWRQRWSDGLATLADEVRALDRRHWKGVVDAATARTNFHLHYQCIDETALQVRYGDLVHAIAAETVPRLAQPRAARARGADARLRVGFASAYFRDHTVTKLFAGWVERLDPARFEKIVFHLAPRTGRGTDRVEAAGEYVSLGRLGAPEQAEAIAARALDALVYFDIGMDPRAQFLAALRLAPVQAVAFGHPATSGLPTVDYFLSADAIEPPDAERFYRETLVRLPGIALCYAAPDAAGAVVPACAARAGDGAVVYLNAQSTFKLLPQFDPIYPRIAREVPNARFWFLRSPINGIAARFWRRLERAFARHGLDATEYCTVHPGLPYAEFLGLNGAADVLLDSILWSGGNSTLEGLAMGRPLVTLEGPMLRGRVSAAFLRRIGIEETIARDPDEYVRIAIALGRDPERRAALAQRVAAASPRLWNDSAGVDGLGRFLERAVVDAAEGRG